MQFHREKTNTQISHKSLLESLSKNTWKDMKLKYPRPATKEDKNCFFMIVRPLPDRNCSLFIRHKEYKSQATSCKYRPCSHSLQQSGHQYSFSYSAKPAGGFKQLCNRCMSFWMATEEIVFLHCSYFCNCTKNQISCCSHYRRVF